MKQVDYIAQYFKGYRPSLGGQITSVGSYGPPHREQGCSDVWPLGLIVRYGESLPSPVRARLKEHYDKGQEVLTSREFWALFGLMTPLEEKRAKQKAKRLELDKQKQSAINPFPASRLPDRRVDAFGMESLTFAELGWC